MFIETTDSKYYIKRQGATFPNRLGHYDCIVFKKDDKHGMILDDGNKYIIISRYDAESGELFRKSQPLPNEITLKKLRQWGFIDEVTPTRWLPPMSAFMRLGNVLKQGEA